MLCSYLIVVVDDLSDVAALLAIALGEETTFEAMKNEVSNLTWSQLECGASELELAGDGGPGNEAVVGTQGA